MKPILVQRDNTIMSTTQLLLSRLPSTSEINLAKVIEEFAYSRTVDELHEGVEKMILRIDPQTQGMSPAGFRMLLFKAIGMSIDQAKTMFIREQYDDIEWERLGYVLLRMHVPVYSDHSGPEYTDESSDSEM